MSNRKRKWTHESVREEALKYKTRTEFLQKAPETAWQYAKEQGIYDEICSHMPNANRVVAEEEIRQAAAKYTTRVDFINGDNKMYSAAVYRGILEDVCSHMTPPRTVGKKKPKWSLEKVMECAKECKTRIEFSKRFKGAYMAAYRLNILDEVFATLEGKTYWTEDMIKEEASKYSTRADFQKNSKGAYLSAFRKGIVDEVCQHMGEAKKGYSTLKEGFFYIYRLPEHIGFGITNNIKVRNYDHKVTFKKLGILAELLKVYSGGGLIIKTMEEHLKSVLPIAKNSIKCFKTEAVLPEHLTLLIDEIQTFLTNNADCGITEQTNIEV
jgi:hypothetical protein